MARRLGCSRCLPQNRRPLRRLRPNPTEETKTLDRCPRVSYDEFERRRGGWDDSSNVRRCVLIDEKYAEGLSLPEEAELERLQDELDAHQRRGSPRPVVIFAVAGRSAAAASEQH